MIKRRAVTTLEPSAPGWRAQAKAREPSELESRTFTIGLSAGLVLGLIFGLALGIMIGTAL